MPLYEYECAKCGERFEEIEKFSDPPLEEHEGCGGKVRRLLSAPAIQFKGSGWYITDYARAGKTDGSNDKGEKEGEKKSETKTETKSENSDSKKAGDSGASSTAPAKTTPSEK